ncbi:hypothetical protein BHE74_00052822 [Ensete ventricosum]|nr:hypothetical protein BHE74_00052822 [Ensete ventricosum]RZS25082.1 hypothetical protein BHM03_00058235 [Ensete ventricosum]
MMRRGLGFGLPSLLRPGRFAATPLGRKVGALSFLFRRSISSTGGDVSARCCYRGQRGFCGYAVEQFSDDEYECEFGSHKFSTNQLALRARDSLASWTPDCIGFNLIEAVLCHICRKERPGAALVFMTGWDDISCLRDQLRAHPLLGDPNRVLVLTCHGSMATSEQVSPLARFAISTFTARYGQYILVRQVAGTWIARYRAVPPKIDRRWSIEGEIDREREKGKKKKNRKKKKKKKEKRRKRIPIAGARSSPVRRRSHAVAAYGSPAPARRHCPRVTGAFSPARGERSR